MFNPSRLACARKSCGLSKSTFADLIGVDLRSISAYEAGDTIPREKILERIVAVTGFPLEFFSGDDLEEPTPHAVSFRAMTKMTARQRDMAISQGTIAIHLGKFIENRFDLPVVDIPDLSYESTPEAASETLRRHWGIGALPINNVIHLLESRGVRVFSLAVEAREVDAFSLWRSEIPMVFLNTFKTSEHSRYDAAHELGHLVLHRHAQPNGPQAEREANAFASSFLMPRASILAYARKNPKFGDLVRLKTIWKVSVAALNYRLHSVGMVSDWQYRNLCIEIAKYGRKREPNEIPRETSQLLPKIFAALQEESFSRAEVARILAIPRSELEQLLFGLTFAAINGGSRRPPSKSGNRRLQIVES
jgi:Zn-dependent peptidase ImmA (M78 family)/transcriptional regulator with XRE-family HTH domain